MMADFLIAFRITAKTEGGYADNPSDHGKETYAGISRSNWPNWEGWHHLDTIKENYGDAASVINTYASKDVVLQSLIQSFYKSNFWNPLQLDQINDQQIASAVYDFGVNAGIGTAARKLQTASGVTADGQIGSITISAVNNGNAADILGNFNLLRESFYRQIASKPGQGQFLASWMSRIKAYQT